MDDKQRLYIGKEVDIKSGELTNPVDYKTKDLSTFELKKDKLNEKINKQKDKKEEAEVELRAISKETSLDIGASVVSMLMGRSARRSISRATRKTTRCERAKLKKQKADLNIEKLNMQIEEIEKETKKAVEEKGQEVMEKANRTVEKYIRPKATSINIKYIGVIFR